MHSRMNTRRAAASLALLLGVLAGCQTKTDLTTSGTKRSGATREPVATEVAPTSVTTSSPATTAPATTAPSTTAPAPPATNFTPRVTLPTIPTGDGCGSYVNSNGNTICTPPVNGG
jgi:hypothetical protein